MNVNEDLISNSKSSYEKNFCEFVKNIVCSYYGQDIELFDQKSRKRAVIKLRQVAIYLMCKNSKMTLESIGRFFRKDHATVLYSRNVLEGYLIWDKELKKELDELQNLIELKSRAILENFSLEKDFYYIDMNDFYSIKNKEKAIILSGYTKEEIENFKKLNNINIKEVEHNKTGMYILNKIENEKNENNNQSLL